MNNIIHWIYVSLGNEFDAKTLNDSLRVMTAGLKALDCAGYDFVDKINIINFNSKSYLIRAIIADKRRKKSLKDEWMVVF